MKCLVIGYFKDNRGEWHQPGNVDEFTDPEEIETLRNRGGIKIIETAMVEAPESRVIQMKRRVRR